jgi:hypothetical protein
VLESNVAQQDEECLVKVFIDLGDHCPKFLRPHLEKIIELSLGVCSDGLCSILFFHSPSMQMMATKELEDSWKQLALELVVTIAENAPAMMRKHSKYLPKIGV